jgi:hypothetical protein
VQVHRGVLHVSGDANGRLEFRRADGTQLGERARVTAHARRGSQDEADVISGLRRMGVAAVDARRAVAEAVASGADDLEALLRAALLILRRTTYANIARVVDPARA